MESKSSRFSEKFLGKTFKSNSCGYFEVVSYLSARKVEIAFKKTGYKTWTRSSLVLSGEIRDPYSPSCYGVGFIGEGVYTATKKGKHIKAYKCWSHMIERCYSNSFHASNSYKGRSVYVCKEWHNYQNFAKWYYDNYKNGLELDKDIYGHKLYSPETCCFIPKSINSALTINRSKSRELPIGVSVKEGCTGFIACITMYGLTRHLGVFKTKEEAFSVYASARKLHLRDLGEKELRNGRITEEIFNKLLDIEILPYP